ncbi:FAD-linked sulfhydryl oxidase ERV1-like isoform X1 [Rhododendron vialii]|uniref:FAD-linked sulfhydryl oxidase ERV1-like isoform X1 n=1 Tax=Rhododendron vialii TaxID=182163 RepID=UPI00265E634E|nr:FAD-linked sulfhydryl oxidase ERV1-like isoform X1 [Rhododendron vialii]
MSENPFQAIFLNLEKISHGVQTLLSQFAGLSNHQSSPPTNGRRPLFSLASSFNPNPLNASSNSSVLLPKELTNEGKSATPVTKEELGRATWIFLHTLAAQYPDKPTRQQQKDVKDLMDILSRMYPCKECADHFKEILRANPVQVGSQAEFSQWLCHVHNVVNRSLGKVVFSCERVDAKWGKLDCEQRTCDLQGNTKIFGDKMQ